MLPTVVEGASSRWVFSDDGTVGARLRSPEARDFYALEGLWADATVREIAPS